MDVDDNLGVDSAVWVVRLWYETDQDDGLRARISHSPPGRSTGTHSMYTEAAASAADIEQSLRRFVRAFTTRQQSTQ